MLENRVERRVTGERARLDLSRGAVHSVPPHECRAASEAKRRSVQGGAGEAQLAEVRDSQQARVLPARAADPGSAACLAPCSLERLLGRAARLSTAATT